MAPTPAQPAVQKSTRLGSTRTRHASAEQTGQGYPRPRARQNQVPWSGVHGIPGLRNPGAHDVRAGVFLCHLASPPKEQVGLVGTPRAWGGKEGGRAQQTRIAQQASGRKAGAAGAEQGAETLTSRQPEARAPRQPTGQGQQPGARSREDSTRNDRQEATGSPAHRTRASKQPGVQQDRGSTRRARGQRSGRTFSRTPRARGSALSWSSVGGEPLRGPKHVSAWGPRRAPNGRLDPPSPRLRAAVVPAVAAASEPRRPR